MESSIEASPIGGSLTNKPTLAPKPRLTPKPFSLQQNSSIRSIHAPKASPTTVKPPGKIEAPGVVIPTPSTPTPKTPQPKSTSGPKPSPVSAVTKAQPKPTTVSQPKDLTSQTTPSQERPKSEPNHKVDIVNSLEQKPNVREDEQKSAPDAQNREESGGDGTSAGTSMYHLGSVRKRLPAALTSMFESGGPPPVPKPLTNSAKDTSSKPVSSIPETSKETPEPSNKEWDEPEVKEDYTGGSSIKRRISQLFDSSSRPEALAKTEEPVLVNGRGDVKERIKNWTAESGSDPEKEPEVVPRARTRSIERAASPVPEKIPEIAIVEPPAAETSTGPPVLPLSKFSPPEQPAADQTEESLKASEEPNNSTPSFIRRPSLRRANDGDQDGSENGEHAPSRDNIKRRSVRFGTVERDDGGPPLVLGSASESSSEEEDNDESHEDETKQEELVSVPVYRRVSLLQRKDDEVKNEEEEKVKHEEFEKKRRAEEQEQARLKLEEEIRLEKEREKERERERENLRLKEEEKQQEILKEQEEQERQRKAEQERQRLQEEERERERLRAEMERERRREEERERARQIEEKLKQERIERERLREEEIRQQKLREDRERQRQEEEERERVRQAEKLRQEKERLREEADERERARLRRLEEEERMRDRLRREEEEERKRREFERKLQQEKEDEKERIRQMEKQREEERRRQIERERAEELERRDKEEMERMRLIEKQREEEVRKQVERERLEELERKKREDEMERLRQIDKQREDEIRRQIERERMEELERRIREEERERLRLIQKQKEEEIRRKIEKEREEEMEQMRLREKQREEEIRRQIEKERMEELERRIREEEMERLKLIEKQKEEEIRRKIEKEREEEMEQMRLRERQREEEIRRQVEKERMEELERKIRQEETERLRQIEKQREEERRIQIEKEREEEMEQMRLRERQREEEIRRQIEKERMEELERRVRAEETERLRQIEKQREEMEKRLREEMLQREEEQKRKDVWSSGRENEKTVDGAEPSLAGFDSEDVNQRSSYPSRSTGSPTDSTYDDFSVKAPVCEVLYDDFSVKPRIRGTRNKVESAPVTHSRATDLLDKDETPVPLDVRPQESKAPDWMEKTASAALTPASVDVEAKNGRKESKKKRVLFSDVEEVIPRDEEEEEIEVGDEGWREAQVDSYHSNVEDKDTDALIVSEPDKQEVVSEQLRDSESPQPVLDEVPDDTAEDPDASDFQEEPELVPFPESTVPLLDTTAQRSRVALGKRRSRSRPTRSFRAGLDEKERRDWRTHDTSDEKENKLRKSESENVQPTSKEASSPASQRVPAFPGLSPADLIAQLKKRTPAGGSGGVEEAGARKASEERESQNEEATPSPSQLSRSPRLASHLAGAARVLPPIGGKEGDATSSPAWLKELKSKKRLSQYDGEA